MNLAGSKVPKFGVMLYRLSIAICRDLTALGTASCEVEDEVDYLGVVLVRKLTSKNGGRFSQGGGTVVKAVCVGRVKVNDSRCVCVC